MFADLRLLLAACAATLLFLAVAPGAHAASVTSDGTTATFTADPGERDHLSVDRVDADTVEFGVSDDTIVEGAGCTEVDIDQTRCDATQRVVVDARDGNDVVSADTLKEHATSVSGGDGQDVLRGGQGPDDVSGGPGNDTLLGITDGATPSTDRLDGGEGDDTIFQPTGADDVIGGPGADAVTVIVGDLGGIGVTPANFSITPDGLPNDMRPADGANVHADVEHVYSYFTTPMAVGIDGGWASNLTYYDEGSLSVRGTDGPNHVDGGTDDDDLDPLGGNDVVSAGIGDDRVNVVDGYADRVACGPGVDTVSADTLDDVSDTCEDVQRTDAGNANDVPEVPEDAPPAVTLTTGPALTATAADDRGVAAVQFLDDDRLLCTDDAAPYTCDYAPRGDDVGRNTITAVAIDTAQQTASDRRVVAVPKFVPAAVTLRVQRRRASGRVLLPAQVSPALGCSGTVALKVRGGRTRQLRLRPDCTFGARLKLRRRARVRAVFAGNEVLQTSRSRMRSVR